MLNAAPLFHLYLEYWLPSIIGVRGVGLTVIEVDRSDSSQPTVSSTRGDPNAQPRRPQQLPFDAVISHDARMAASAGIAAKVSQVGLVGTVSDAGQIGVYRYGTGQC